MRWSTRFCIKQNNQNTRPLAYSTLKQKLKQTPVSNQNKQNKQRAPQDERQSQSETQTEQTEPLQTENHLSL